MTAIGGRVEDARLAWDGPVPPPRTRFTQTAWLTAPLVERNGVPMSASQLPCRTNPRPRLACSHALSGAIVCLPVRTDDLDTVGLGGDGRHLAQGETLDEVVGMEADLAAGRLLGFPTVAASMPIAIEYAVQDSQPSIVPPCLHRQSGPWCCIRGRFLTAMVDTSPEAAPVAPATP